MLDFSEKYNNQNFISFLKNILPFKSISEPVKVSEKSIFKSINKIGYVDFDDNIPIYEVEHNSKNDPRIELTNKFFSIMSSFSIKKSLVIFYCSDSDKYRFSLVESSLVWATDTKIKREFSSPKRLSYLLGVDAKIHTPYNQFKNRIKNYQDLRSRFDKEVVTAEFFKNYKSLLLSLDKYLKNDEKFKKFTKKIKLDTTLFAKKLLGQIVFCYFLQKKNWLGAKKNTNLDNGDQNFLRNRFNEIDSNKSFFNDFLEPLFYLGLNNDNPNSFCEKLNCKVPYLNGGLFEPIENYNWEKEDLNIPNTLFSNEKKDGILDIFDLYNFTVDENEDLDVEIAIDPEMLGNVFENLLPENLRKTSGSFYTPRKVVSYMCEQSISNFLMGHFYKEFNKSDLDNFLSNKDTIINLFHLEKKIFSDQQLIIPKFIIKNKDKLLEILKNIKICDPAIGSGAFAIGMLQEVTKVLKILNFLSGDEISDYNLRRNFIENNIYGVDFDPGAIEITKLRLWLSLIIEDFNTKVNPLPNLDFKIMQGDSLTEEFLGITLSMNNDKEVKKQFLLGEQPELKKNLIKELYKKQLQYFNLSSLKPKKKLKSQIEELIKKIFLLELEKIDPKKSNKKILKEKISEFGLNYSQRNFFPWSLYFNDVLNIKNGFDIIIGNPPYVDSEEMTKVMPEKRELYNKTFITAKGNWDLYIPFYELGFKLLNDKGILSYIAPNKWLSIKYGGNLRKFLNNSFIQICKCEKIKVFDAGNSPSINFFAKNNQGNKILIHEFEDKLNFNILGSVSSSSISLDNWGILLSENILNIVKIKNKFNKKITDFYKVENPFSTAEAYKLKEIIEDKKFSNDFFYFINTGTIDPFINLWGLKNTSYLKEKFLYPVIKRSKLKSLSLKRFNQSRNEKIIITAMRYFESFYDLKGDYVAGKSTIVVFKLNSKYNLKSLNVLLNSEFIANYIKSSYSALGIDGGINFSKNIVEELPLPNNFDKIQKKLEDYHDKIVSYTSDETNFKKIKDEINVFVYKAYDSNKEDFH